MNILEYIIKWWHYAFKDYVHSQNSIKITVKIKKYLTINKKLTRRGQSFIIRIKLVTSVTSK